MNKALLASAILASAILACLLAVGIYFTPGESGGFESWMASHAESCDQCHQAMAHPDTQICIDALRHLRESVPHHDH